MKDPIDEEVILSLLKLLIDNKGSIINNSCGDFNALSFTYEHLDFRYFQCLLENSENLEIFNSVDTKKLIYDIVSKKDWKYVQLLLNKSVASEQEDVFILSLAKRLLTENQIELSKLVISKCTNRNINFKKGETFLTCIIKENVEESLIISLIESKLFDINCKNDQGQLPFSLAIEKSMENIIGLIKKLNVSNRSSTKHLNNSEKTQSPNIQHNSTNDNQTSNIYNNGDTGSFVSSIVPITDRIFQEIDIGTTVKYYMDSKNSLIDLYGKVLWSGLDKHGQYYYGLELETERTDATDGMFEGCKLFECKPFHGTLAPINKVGLDNRFHEKVENIECIISEDSSTVEYANSNKYFEGINFGIQGNIATSFFDSLLFGLFYKSDVLDYLISAVINDNEINGTTTKFRSVVAYKIIYPLRKNGYVSYDKIEELKSIFKEYGQRYEEFENESNSDNSLLYLAKLCPSEQLLNLISYNNYKSNSMYIQLFGKITEIVNFITSQNLLDMSMINNEVMFNTLPSCLIMNIPTEINEIDLIPLKTIDISQVSIVYFKKCKLCTKRATRQCQKCVVKSQYIIKNGFFCDNHECNHEMMQPIPSLHLESKSKCHLFLKSIVCCEKQRHIAFVQEQFKNRWFRFDNWCSNNKSATYSSPKITFSEVLTKFFSQSDKEMLKDYGNYSSSSDVRLILRKANTFIYINPSMSCY